VILLTCDLLCFFVYGVRMNVH